MEGYDTLWFKRFIENEDAVICTTDLETTTHIENGSKASPFAENSRIVAYGYSEGLSKTGVYISQKVYNSGEEALLTQGFWDWLKKTPAVFGHNIKFDLLWLLVKHRDKTLEVLRGGTKFVCTQVLQYILEGRDASNITGLEEKGMVSLVQLSKMYGGTEKLDEVKLLWEAGVPTEQIPEETLMKYLLGEGDSIDIDGDGLLGDLGNTYLVAKRQTEAIRETLRINKFGKRTPMILINIAEEMEAMMALALMESERIKVSLEIFEKNRSECLESLERLTENLNSLLELPEGFIFNWGSPIHKSALFFGGTVKYQTRTIIGYTAKVIKAPLFDKVPVWNSELVRLKDGSYMYRGKHQDRYKSGASEGKPKFGNLKTEDREKPRYSVTEELAQFKRLVDPKDSWKSSLKDALGDPVWSTSGEVLLELSKHPRIWFSKTLSEWLDTSKDLSSFYYVEAKNGNRSGLMTMISGDEYINPRLNMDITLTGRLSCSKPNAQQFPKPGKSKMRQGLISRFPDGIIAQADLTAAEITSKAVVTLDPVLIDEQLRGIDAHSNMLAMKLGMPYGTVINLKKAKDPSITAQRNKIKAGVFSLEFGAYPPKISEQSGLSLEEATELMERHRERYAHSYLVEDAIREHLDLTAVRSKKYKDGIVGVNSEGVQYGRVYLNQGFFLTRTGVLFKFTQRAFENKRTGILGTAWYMPQIKNKPVQGTAAQFVKIILGMQLAWWLQYPDRDLVAFIITIHDANMGDCANMDVLEDVNEMWEETFGGVIPYLKEMYGLDVPFNTSYEVSIGSNFYNLEEMKLRGRHVKKTTES